MLGQDLDQAAARYADSALSCAGNVLRRWLVRRLSDSPLGRIAWADFIRFNQPHVQLFDLLTSYYNEAVDMVTSEDWDDTVVSMLAYHLAALYVWAG